MITIFHRDMKQFELEKEGKTAGTEILAQAVPHRQRGYAAKARQVVKGLLSQKLTRIHHKYHHCFQLNIQFALFCVSSWTCYFTPLNAFPLFARHQNPE